jgi:membrane protease YdiL (CAAX protease family)
MPVVWRGRDPLIGFGALVGALIALVATVGVILVGFDLQGASEDFAVAIVGIGYEVMFAAAVLLLANHRGLTLRDLGFRRPDRWGPMGVAVAGAYAIMIGYGLLITLLQQLGVDTSLIDQGNDIPNVDIYGTHAIVVLMIVYGLAVVVVAPLAEEIFFRGLIFRALAGIWPSWAAIAASGIAFGAFHLNVSVILPFSLVGMLFAWCFRQSRSLWVSIGAHFIFNTVSFIFTVIGVIW